MRTIRRQAKATSLDQRVQQAAAKAQTIAGIYRQDVVADIHRALGESAAKGTPFAKFRDAVERQLTAKGLHLDQAGDMVDTATGELLGKGITPQRLEVIYRTNMQNAYMAGRWQELQDNRAAMPYLQYTAVMDNRTRPLHREQHPARSIRSRRQGERFQRREDGPPALSTARPGAHPIAPAHRGLRSPSRTAFQIDDKTQSSRRKHVLEHRIHPHLRAHAALRAPHQIHLHPSVKLLRWHGLTRAQKNSGYEHGVALVARATTRTGR